MCVCVCVPKREAGGRAGGGGVYVLRCALRGGGGGGGGWKEEGVQLGTDTCNGAAAAAVDEGEHKV